eukprot:9075072-Ditylum_brightwellii.AAC.1
MCFKNYELGETTKGNPAAKRKNYKLHTSEGVSLIQGQEKPNLPVQGQEKPNLPPVHKKSQDTAILLR